MSFACRARRFHILRSFYNTSQVIKPLLLQVDYKMVRQTLAFLVLFIVVTLQSAQIQGYSFWKLCVGVCVGPIPFWVPGCQRLCWALSYQGAHSMPALAETFFSPRKTLFSEHGIAKKQLKYIKHATKRAQFIWSIFGGKVVWMRVRVQPAAIQIHSLPKNIKIFSTSH